MKKISCCKNHISSEEMPILIDVTDAVLEEESMPLSILTGSFVLEVTPQKILELGVHQKHLTDLLRAEKRWDITRWIYLEHLFEKICIYTLLIKSDVTGTLADKEHIWLQGRGIPVQNYKAMAKARGITGFRQGVEFGLLRPVQLILYALLGYQLHEALMSPAKGSFIPAVGDILLHGKPESIRGALSFIVSNPANAVFLWPLLSFPLVWGGVKAYFYGRRALFRSPDDFQKAITALNIHLSDRAFTLMGKRIFLVDHARKFWWNFLRWLFPLHPMDRQINYLIEALLFNGKLTEIERSEALSALDNFIEKNGGYSRIVGLSAQQKIASGLALKQFDLSSEFLTGSEDINEDISDTLIREYQLGRLKEKVQALQRIHDYNPGFLEAWRRDKIWGLVHNSYAHYLRWTLGDWDSRSVYAGYLTLKTGKIVLLVNLGLNIYDAILDYLRCPLPYESQDAFSKFVLEQQRTAYTQTCFNTLLAAFNKIPGQPACTLVNLLPQVAISPSLKKLDLSNLGLTGIQVADLLTGLKQYYPEVKITELDLSGNQINRKEDFEVLMPHLQQIRKLWLDDNNIGSGLEQSTAGKQGATALADGLKYLPNLLELSLKNNVLLGNDFSEIVNGLKFTPQIQYFDCSFNFLNSLSVIKNLRLARNLKSLILANNRCSSGLETLTQELKYLHFMEILNLSNNGFGFSGTRQLEFLASSLKYIPRLRELDLSNNSLDYAGTNGTEILGKNLKFIPLLENLNLEGNCIGFHGTDGVQSLGENMQFLTHMKKLILRFNSISNGTKPLSHALRYLPELAWLDISRNAIGLQDTDEISSLISTITQLPLLQKLYVMQGRDVFTDTQLRELRDYWKNRNSYTDLYMLNTIQDVKQYLAQLPRNTKSINLSGNLPYGVGWLVGEGVVDTLMKGLKDFPMIEELDLSNMGWFSGTAQRELAAGLQYVPNLKKLILSSNKLGMGSGSGRSIINFYNAFCNISQLVFLDLSNNFIGTKNPSEELIALGRMLPCLTKLQHLDLSINVIWQTTNLTSTQSFIDGLQQLSHFRFLNISTTYLIHDADIQLLASGFGHLSELQVLDLSKNSIGQANSTGTIALAESLKNLTQLRGLFLQSNEIGATGPEGALALSTIVPSLVCHNPYLRAFNLGINIHNLTWQENQQLRDAGFLYYSQIQDACKANSCYGGTVDLPTRITCENQRHIPTEEVCYIFSGPSSSSAASSLSVPLPYQLLISAFSATRAAIASSNTASPSDVLSITWLTSIFLLSVTLFALMRTRKPTESDIINIFAKKPKQTKTSLSVMYFKANSDDSLLFLSSQKILDCARKKFSDQVTSIPRL